MASHRVGIGVDRQLRLQRRADLPVLAHAFEHARGAVADRQQVGPPAPLLGRSLRRGEAVVPGLEQHAFATLARQRLPDFLAGERQDRRQPAHQRLGDAVHRALRAAPAVAVGRHGVEAVLGDVEVERAHLVGAEVLHARHHLGEVVALVGGDHRLLHVERLLHRPLVQRQAVFDTYQMLRGIKTVEVAEQEARGVAQAAVAVRHALEDLVGDAHLIAVIGRGHPQAQHVGAQAVHHLLRRHHVAQRLGHLAARGVHGETVGEHVVVGCAAVDRRRGEQGRLEPAAVLVGAFQVHHLVVVRIALLQLAALADHAEVGDAGVEPHVEHIGDLVVVLGLVAQEFSRVEVVPRVDAALFHALRHLLHQRHGIRVRLLRRLVHEQRDRHAPGALAADAPVGTPGHHAGDALLAPTRHPAHVLDRLQRGGAQGRLFHADEPLRRGAEDHRRLVAPAVRVAVFDLRVRQQHAARAQQLDDRVVGLPNVHAGEVEPVDFRRVVAVGAARADVVEQADAVLAADHEVLHAVIGRGVHRAGAVLGADVLAEDHRHHTRVERVVQSQATQRRTGGMAQHPRRFHAVARQCLVDQRGGDHQQHALAVARRAFDQRIVQFRAQRHRLAFRQRPRRGGPDRHGDDGVARVHAELRRQRLGVHRVVGHVHRRRDLVAVFDLRLGQRRTAVEAPVHRLGAAHHVAVGDDARQGAQHVGLVGEIHRAVRIFPVAQHAQALEAGALGVDLFGGVFAALLAERARVELLARLAVLLLHRDLDRQAMAIPARHVGRAMAGQQLGAHHHVLEDLVDRVADVDRAVRIGRAVVQHEGLAAAGGLRLDLRVTPDLFPCGQPGRLALGQIAAHREIRLRQVDGALVIGAHRVPRWFRPKARQGPKRSGLTARRARRQALALRADAFK